jgi:3-phosphoshikimate 1-carboxyvinyltransferase
MHFVVEPSVLKSGTASVPGDKSISHRALMLGGIATGTTNIRGFLSGEDCMATLVALRAMGVSVLQHSATAISVAGAGKRGLKVPQTPLDMGNSGTAMRLFAGLLSGQSFPTELTGDASLCRRPMGRVIKPLGMMGAKIESDDGKPPLRISPVSQLSGTLYSLPVASAQVKSAILLAGLYANGDTVVVEPAVTRDHTERMLRLMGAGVVSGESQIMLHAGQELSGTDIDIPADLSSAAFLMLAALLAGDCELLIKGVGVNPTRTGVIDILREMGGDISLQNVRLYGEEPVADLVVRSSLLHGIDVSADRVSLAIDEFPVLFVAAAGAIGETRFAGIGELRVKESDRIESMATGLRSLGISVDETDDGATVRGGKIGGGTVDSFGDHRVAMAFAVAGTQAGTPLLVKDTAAVNTSFPGFAECLRALGVEIREVEETCGART